MHVSSPARLRLDVCCNDPDNGIFAHQADALHVDTWDGESIEFEARSLRLPRFSERPGAIRICRRNWPILASTEWYGNWCWNAYWLAPGTLLDLLAAVKKSRLFYCGQAPSQLYDNWNNDAAPLLRDLWAANLWGRHSVGTVDA